MVRAYNVRMVAQRAGFVHGLFINSYNTKKYNLVNTKMSLAKNEWIIMCVYVFFFTKNKLKKNLTCINQKKKKMSVRRWRWHLVWILLVVTFMMGFAYVLLKKSKLFETNEETLVHQIWIHDDWCIADGIDALPSKYIAPLNSWKRKYGSKHRLYDRDTCREVMRTFFPGYLDVYDNMDTNVERADMARYAILWAYGGFYTDLDTTMLRPIDVFVDNTRFHTSIEFFRDDGEYGYTQFAFASPAAHPILLDILRNIKSRIRHPIRQNMSHDERIFWTTGPVVFSGVINRHLKTNPGSVTIHKLGTFGSYKTQCTGAYLKHHFDGSWKQYWSSEFADW